MRRHSTPASRVRKETIELRPARASELESLADTGFRSFHSGERDLWFRNVYHQNPYLAPADTLVARIGGRVAGHSSGYRFTMSLAGRDVPVRGIAAVAVLPDFRRRGVADALMRGTLRRMRRAGEPLTMLYAFRMSFYRRFGWGVVEWCDTIRAEPSQLPASPLRRNVRTLERPADQPQVERLYERTRRAWTGPFVRERAWWDIRVWSRASDGVVYVNPDTGRFDGYAIYDIPADPPYPRQIANVRELVARTPEAFRGLVGYFEALGEQFRWLEFVLPRGEGPGLLEDYGLQGTPESLRLFQSVGFASAGALLRIVDVPAAFALHPMPAKNRMRGTIGIDVDDPVFGARGSSFDVRFGARGARVTPGRSARDRVRLGAADLAQVYGGGVSLALLHRHGRITGSPRAAEALDEAFAGTQTFLMPMNGF
jgi:predicted acetyltransferase